MAKKNKATAPAERSYQIMSANIKDDFCHYSFKVLSGIGIGDTNNVKGVGIIKEDMRDAFMNFNKHLAVVDDVFKHSNVEITNIDLMDNYTITGMFHVTGFKIIGDTENESVVLKGTKYVSAGGRIELATPKIPLDSLSSYTWYNELKAAVDVARNEVALYKEGKCDAPKAEDKVDPKQLRIGQSQEEKEEENEFLEAGRQ